MKWVNGHHAWPWAAMLANGNKGVRVVRVTTYLDADFNVLHFGNDCLMEGLRCARLPHDCFLSVQIPQHSHESPEESQKKTREQEAADEASAGFCALPCSRHRVSNLQRISQLQTRPFRQIWR